MMPLKPSFEENRSRIRRYIETKDSESWRNVYGVNNDLNENTNWFSEITGVWYSSDTLTIDG